MSGEPERPKSEPERGGSRATCEPAAEASRGATMSRHGVGLPVLALVLALAGAGCGAEASGLLVRFLSDRTIPDEAENLEVVIADGTDGTVLEVDTYDLVPL